MGGVAFESRQTRQDVVGSPLLEEGTIGMEAVQLRAKPFTSHSVAHKGISSNRYRPGEGLVKVSGR